MLEGSVRKIGNRIRIAAQLVNVTNDYQLWSETFDRQLEDVFAIQDEISRAIADALKIKLMGGAQAEPLVKPATENLEAYTLYLKGRFFVNRLAEHDLHKAQSLFEQALDADPGYARAYSGIADCWSNLADDWVAPEVAYPKAKSAATRAVQLEPTLGEAHSSIGKVLCWYEWDFEGASRALAKAVEYNPNYAEAHFVYGSTLPAVGRLVEAIDEMRKALVLDPLSAHFSRWLGRFLLYAERNEAAMEQSRKTLEIEPSYFQAYLDIGAAELARGNVDASLAAFRQGPVARHGGAVLRRDDRPAARGPGGDGGGRRDHGAPRGPGQDRIPPRRGAGHGARRPRRSRPGVRVAPARLRRPFGRAHLPPPRPGLRAAAEGPALRRDGPEDRVALEDWRPSSPWLRIPPLLG